MELYLQFGYGMMAHSEELIGRWGKGTVILSPRDLTPKQIPTFAKKILRAGGRCLIDPQFYEPRANMPRLNSHPYWLNDYSTSLLSNGLALDDMLVELSALNESARTEAFIVPGIYAPQVDGDWVHIQNMILEKASHYIVDRSRIATICLSEGALRSREQVEEVLAEAEAWNVDGYYVVCEHPANQYLVADPLWLSNLLMLSAGLKLHGRTVIVGYSAHQSLCLASANVDAIASGTWLNVRSFTTDKFIQPEEDQQMNRAT